MELSLLADHPEAADVVARWYFDQWAYLTPGKTLEQVKARVAASVSRQSAPMLVLARRNGVVIGAAELKIREMEIYPDKEFWLGGVYVDEAERGKGVAASLVNEVLSRAKAAGIQRLYLQTEKLDGGLYTKHGFQPLEEIFYKGRPVLVMVASTGA
jgi:GNAT superfamily N-acetyltransferase